MIPRRCRYFVVTKELMERVLLGADHLHLPSDAKLIGYEKKPMNDDFFVIVYSDTFDYVPIGKPFPVMTVTFIQKNRDTAPARATPAHQGEQR